jgi:hypothetical protein
MRSFLAALRSLVLPFGQTTGTRLVIDGTLGRISGFDASNDEVLRIDVSQGFFTALGSSAAQLQAGTLDFFSDTSFADTFFQRGEWGMSENGVNYGYFRQQIGSGTTPRFQSSVPIIKDGSWTAVSYQNGWSDFGGAYSGASYRMMPDGTVRFRGTCKPGTRTDFTIIFTIGSDYYPATYKQLRPRHDATSGNGFIEVQTNGNVIIAAMAGVNAITLDGMTYDGPGI